MVYNVLRGHVQTNHNHSSRYNLNNWNWKNMMVVMMRRMMMFRVVYNILYPTMTIDHIMQSILCSLLQDHSSYISEHQYSYLTPSFLTLLHHVMTSHTTNSYGRYRKHRYYNLHDYCRWLVEKGRNRNLSQQECDTTQHKGHARSGAGEYMFVRHLERRGRICVSLRNC